MFKALFDDIASRPIDAVLTGILLFTALWRLAHCDAHGAETAMILALVVAKK